MFRRLRSVVIVVLLVLAYMLLRRPPHKSQQVATEAPPPPPDTRIEEVDITFDESEGAVSLARNFYFIFDGSGSMKEQCAGKQKLLGAQQAVNVFMQRVPDDVALGLYVFDADGAREVVPLGEQAKDRFLQAVGEVRAGGGTPLASAILTGVDRLVEQYKRQLGYGDFRLVVVTDGEADSIPEAATYATRYRIPVYTIGLCMHGSHPLHEYSVSYRAADNYEDLARALEETVAETEAFDVTEFE